MPGFMGLISIFNQSNSIVAFRQAKAEHPNKKAPDLHPLLAALAIVLDNNEDFSLITENHPELPRHKFYNPSAFFPDLSLFPPKEDCWWEDLGALCLLHPFLLFTLYPQLSSLS